MNLRTVLGTSAFWFAVARAGTVAAAAEPPQYTFAQIWAMAEQGSPALRAARHETEAARIGATRATRHWYPRLYADARVFATDDPALTFMSLLGQRQIEAADFAPQDLNEPGSSVFQKATLGLDFPLYEGGMRAAAAAAAQKGAEAKSWAQTAEAVNEYTTLAQSYAALLTLDQARTQLGALRDEVSGVIEGYEIGARENPVGYSGLLGLRSLRNRIDGLLAANEAQAVEMRSRIEPLAGALPASWQPAGEAPRLFLSRVLPVRARNLAALAPVRAAQSAAESAAESKGAERAKFLPRVGVFGQGDLYGGSRALAGSYTAGAYLNWELFSAPNFGAVAQASESAAAARERASALRRQLESGHQAALVAVASLEKNVALLEESAGLLDEQTATARTLFRNGSISALQLVEVLARRADWLEDRTAAELNLAGARAALALAAGTAPAPVAEGAP